MPEVRRHVDVALLSVGATLLAIFVSVVVARYAVNKELRHDSNERLRTERASVYFDYLDSLKALETAGEKVVLDPNTGDAVFKRDMADFGAAWRHFQTAVDRFDFFAPTDVDNEVSDVTADATGFGGASENPQEHPDLDYRKLQDEISRVEARLRQDLGLDSPSG